MVFFKKRSGLLSKGRNAEQMPSGAMTGKAAVIPSKEEVTESEVSQTEESRCDQGNHSPNADASATTKTSQKSAVRVKRSSGMAKSPATKTTSKKQNSSTNKETKTHKAVGIKKKTTPSDAKNASDEDEAEVVEGATESASPTAELKTEEVLKSGVADDSERDAAAEEAAEEDTLGTADNTSGDDAIVAYKATQHAPTTMTEIFSAASANLTESYRSFEESANKMVDPAVKELQDFGRNASEWGESARVGCTENLITPLLVDGKTLFAKAAGGCGAVVGAAFASTAGEKKASEGEDGVLEGTFFAIFS